MWKAKVRATLARVVAHMNTRFIGRLGLTDAEEDAIVAFVRTL